MVARQFSVFVFSMALALLASASTGRAAEPYESLEFEYTGGPYENEVFRYRLMKPSTVEEGETYPLVLFLHGAGERGDDNERQLAYLPKLMATESHREKFPCYLLAPQCRSGQKWVDVSWAEVKNSPQPKEPSHQMKAAIGMLKRTLAEEKIDPNRVYLTGLSMGGYGSWDLVARHPEWFAAVAPICGGGDVATAKRFADVPLWAFHGDADRAVNVARSRMMIAALKKAGGQPKYTEYPGVGHNSWTPAYEKSDLLEWMFQQRREKKPEGAE